MWLNVLITWCRIAVGRVNFSSSSAEMVKTSSEKVYQVLGEARSLEMIHRDHMAIY
jgi:glutamate 5-kinase